VVQQHSVERRALSSLTMTRGQMTTNIDDAPTVDASTSEAEAETVSNSSRHNDNEEN